MKARVMYYVLCIMGILFFVPPIILNTYPVSPVRAADATPSADIKLKLDELKREIASKAAQIKQEVDRKLKDKAYIGKVKTKSDTSLTLATRSGPKIASINQDTIFESNIKSKKKFSQKLVSEEDYIAALGDIDETGVLIARKIILLPEPNDKQRTFLWGQIISISDNLITLKDRNFKNSAAILPASSSIKQNNFVILVGNKDKNDIFKADFVYVLPQSGVLKPRKAATPSAQTASPSAKPKIKK